MLQHTKKGVGALLFPPVFMEGGIGRGKEAPGGPATTTASRAGGRGKGLGLENRIHEPPELTPKLFEKQLNTSIKIDA